LAGAGDTVGTDQVAKAKPDGSTLLLGSSSTQVTNPLLMPNPPCDTVKDFTPYIIGVVPMVIACNPNTPCKTPAELAAPLNANLDEHRYSSPGMGSIDHLGAEPFKREADNVFPSTMPLAPSCRTPGSRQTCVP